MKNILHTIFYQSNLRYFNIFHVSYACEKRNITPLIKTMQNGIINNNASKLSGK